MIADRWSIVAGRGWLRNLGVLLPLLATPVSGQQSPPHYNPAALAGTSFVEQITSNVTTRTGTAERKRAISRTARFGVTLAGDTVIVSGDSLALSESVDGVDRALDASGFLGGRWRLALSASGAAQVHARPFVPGELTEVSDVAAAMDDFFPRTPPALAVNAGATDTARIRWDRLADSAGTQRYQWSLTRQQEGARTVADTVPLQVREASRENGTMVWSSRGAPLAWTRLIHSEVTSAIRGRTVQAVIDQRITVRRIK
jgi:hypothetical protein